MKLSNKDNIAILKYYKKHVPLLTKTKKNRNSRIDYNKTRKIAQKLLANKMCKCIKSIQKNTRITQESKAIAICNKTVFKKKD